MEQPRQRRIEPPAFDQLVDERLDNGSILVGAFGPLGADVSRIDPDRRDQHEMLADVDAVDLYHHDVESEKIRPILAFIRAAETARL